MLPAGLETSGEPAETLAVIHTDRRTRIRVVLARRALREVRTARSRCSPVVEGAVSLARRNLLRLLESPRNAAGTLSECCGPMRFEHSTEEQPILLVPQPHEATSCESCCLH
jgi:hypothetical protein